MSRIFQQVCSLLILALGQYPQITYCQDNSVVFYEIIQEDSALLFFTTQNNFVDRSCADFVRYTRLDDTGFFDGPFEDRNHENTLIGKGNYRNGNKEGYFQLHYPNGTIRSRGSYRNGLPHGEWEYFYENGSPERTLSITETDTLLVRFFDRKGNLKVNEGMGEFEGSVGWNSNSSNLIKAKGKIENGKPHGKWMSTVYNNVVYCKEVFDHGKLLRGVFPNAQLGGDKEYHDQSFLNNLFLPGYVNSLEEFKLESCADSVRRAPRKYSFDMASLSSDLREKIDRIIENDFRAGKAGDYSIGDNQLSIQFTLNNKGKAEDFRLLTPWGQQFVHAIRRSIETQTIFPTGSKTMYFHLKLTFPGGSTYQYHFHFSGNRMATQ